MQLRYQGGYACSSLKGGADWFICELLAINTGSGAE